jgi:glycosyltransferase involved in cell wall biosynthesis
MKVVHFLPSIAEGGAPMGAMELAQRQLELGTDVHVIVLDRKTAPLDARFSDLPVQFLEQHYQFGHRRSVDRCVSCLLERLNELNPEILHCHLWPATLISAKAKLAGATPQVIAHIRDTPSWLNSISPRNLIKRYCFRRETNAAHVRFIAVSSEANAYSARGLRISQDRIATVVNAIDPRRFESATTHGASTTFNIGVVGRLSLEKGHADFLQSVLLMPRKDSISITIVGTGSQRSRLVEFAKSNQMEKYVHFVDSVTNMGAFLSAQNLVVMPSRGAEGLPRIVMEAMWCGTPVLATHTSGVADAIQHNQNGIIVKQGDLRSMAREMDRLMHCATDCRALGEMARQSARELFDIDRMIKEISAQYTLVLRNGSSAC